MADCLTADAIADALTSLPGWSAIDADRAITKSYSFADFSEAWGFMSRAALAAEAMDHHPDWSNTYKTVNVRLTTHDAGGVTDRDIRLARAMEAIAGKH